MKFYRSWQGVRALTFDLDDTLYENGEVIRRAELWLNTQLKERFVETAHLNSYHFLSYKKRVLQGQPMLHHDVSACRLAWLELLFNDCGVSSAPEQARQLMIEFIAVRSDFSVPQASLELLESLAERFPLVAITNGNVDAQQIGLSDYFIDILSPGEGVRRKPWPDLFTLAQQRLNLPPQQVAHIGDHPVTDVAGALASGFRAIWLNTGQRNTRLRRLPDIEITSITELEALLTQ